MSTLKTQSLSAPAPTPPPRPPEADRAYPVLRIDDYGQAKAFYVDWLGFTIDWEYRFGPDAPVYMSVTRRGVSLHLTAHRGDCNGGGAVHFEVADVRALHVELKSRRPNWNDEPVDQAWGLCELTITDPFDNRLKFASPLPSEGGAA